MSFLEWLESLGISTWIREGGSIWAYPTVLWLHTMGMGIVVGISAVIDLRLLGCAAQAPIKPLERLYTLMWWGFWLNALSGTGLLMADATTKLRNPDFYIKMVFVFAGVALLQVIRKKVFANPKLDSEPVSSDAKRLAWASLFCWLAAITAGRLLAYVGPVSGLASL
jgi:hypothetical protein